MSLLRNIWRPNDPPQKGSSSPAESVLTERLAELLGRETDEEREPAPRGSREREAASASLSPQDTGSDVATGVPPEEVVSLEPVRSAPPPAPARRPASLLSRPPASSPISLASTPGAASIARATEQALEQLRSAEQQIEADLRNHVREYERTLEAAALAISERGAETDKPLEEAASRFRAEAREWFEEARRELRDQLETSRASLETELERNHQELLETARHKIESMAQASLEATAQSSRGAEQGEIARWLQDQAEASRRQSESGSREVAAAVEGALARLHEAEKKIESRFREQVDEYRRAVEAAAADLEQKGISQAKFQSAALELQQATDQILERSTKRIEQRAEQAVSALDDTLAAAKQTLDTAARASLEKAVEAQRGQWAKAWQEQSRAATESVAQAAAEELKSGSFRQELIAETTAQIERAAKESVSRSASELDQRKEAALSSLSVTLNQASRKFIEDVERRLDAASKAWFESAGQSVREQYRARLAAWLEEQAQIARRQTEAASQSVSRMAEEAKSRLETIARETEATFRGRAEAQQRAWAAGALEAARASGLEQKVVERATRELEKSAAAFLEQSGQKLAQQAESSKQAITAEMDQAARKLLEGVESSLESISWEHRGRLAQWWEERQQAARREAEVNSESVVRAGQQAASQIQAAQAEIEREWKSRAREQQNRLVESTMGELRDSGAVDRMMTEAAGTLRASSNEILSRSNERFREQVEASRLALENQAQASRRGLAEELARMAEQAQASVESAGKAVTEDYRGQLSVWWEERTQSARKESEEAASGIARSARQTAEQLQAMRKEMESELRAGLENYRKGLRDAAAEEIQRQGFQKEALETITAELDSTARELGDRSTRELKQHIEGALFGLDDKVKTTRQNFLNEAQKQLAELTKASLDTAGKRFHEFLAKNVTALEREQEDWLQRRRESVWLDINKASGAPAHSQNSMLERTLLHEVATEAKKKPGQGWLGWVLGVLAVIAMAAALTAVFARLAPPKVITMQLRNKPPDGWVQMNPAWGAKRRAREIQLASAYWLIAVNDLQHQYKFNTALPASPPVEFKVDTGELRDDAATRTRYWDEMRTLWTNPDSWQQTASSGGGTVSKAVEWIRQKLLRAAGKAAQSAGN